MKFTISKDGVSKAISIVSKALAPKSSVAALGGIHVIAKDGKVTFETTDLTTSIRHVASAVVEEEGEAVVSGIVLPKLVKTLPDAAITFETSGTGVMLTCQRSRTRLNTLDPKEFPEFPTVDPDESVELPCDVLGELVRMAAKSVSKDDSRPILKGIMVEVKNDVLRLVSTDSYRLVVGDAPIPAEGVSFKAIIPGDVISDVMGSVGDTGDVSIGTTLNQVSMGYGDTTYVTRRISGSFPDYRQLLPKSNNVRATIDSDDLRAAIKRASVVATDNPAIRIDVSEGTVVLSATSQRDGQLVEEVAADTDGKVAIALNAKFLTDCMAPVDGDVVAEFKDSVSPAVFKSYGEVNYLCLLMPVRM